MDTGSLKIRPAAKGDGLAILRLEEVTPSPWPVEDLFQRPLGRGLYPYLAVLQDGAGDDQVVGWYLLRVTPPEAELYKISVAKEMRRLGLGRLLMAHMGKMAAGCHCKKVYLEMRRADLGLASFYKNLGFTVYGLRPRYYRKPVDDALLLEKSL